MRKKPVVHNFPVASINQKKWIFQGVQTLHKKIINSKEVRSPPPLYD